MDAEPRCGAFPIRCVVKYYLFIFFFPKEEEAGLFGTCASKNEIMEKGKEGVLWQQQ